MGPHQTLLGGYKFPSQHFGGLGRVRDKFEKKFLETIYEKPLAEIQATRAKHTTTTRRPPTSTTITTVTPESVLESSDILELKQDLQTIKGSSSISMWLGTTCCLVPAQYKYF